MGIERLHLFVRICNVCGLFPFRMIVDKATGKFKRFDGSWRHPANWWFLLLVLIGHTYFSVSWVNFSWLHLTIDNDQHISVHLIVFMLFLAILLILFSIPLLFLFFYRRFETAIEILNRVDKKLAKVNHGVCSDRWRMYFGIAITTIGVPILIIIYSRNIG
jgi:hypothetical protein